jgi:inositol-hexakisphosphate/diphosphoinositol-pentakisphosphate 1-kinase
MQEILSRLSEQTFDILIFGNNCILSEPVENWPIVEYLISFYSTGFPLHKAIAYWELRKPFLINDLKMQYNLQDRRTVYRVDFFSISLVTPPHSSVDVAIPSHCCPEPCLRGERSSRRGQRH